MHLVCTYLNCFHLTIHLHFMFFANDTYPVRKSFNVLVTNEMFFSEAAVFLHQQKDFSKLLLKVKILEKL